MADMIVTFKPRRKYVLLRQIKQKVGGLVMPDISNAGVKFVVEAVGEDVPELLEGDEVIMLPQSMAVKLDDAPDLFLVKHSFIISTVERRPKDNDYSA